jgi:DNA-binding NarL/FixJ family response regulator
MKVMIVDDSKVISQGLEKLLNDITGIEITCIAKDGQQAIDEFSKNEPDVIILDLMIPEMNGVDVLKSIRQKNDNTIIIVLTNYNQTYFRKICSELGADYFLDKSADFEKVYHICLNILNPDAEQNTEYLLLNNHHRHSHEKNVN